MPMNLISSWLESVLLMKIEISMAEKSSVECSRIKFKAR